MYGQTEATARIAYLPPELAGRLPTASASRSPAARLSLVDEAGAASPSPRSPGELVYRGPERDDGLRHGPRGPRPRAARWMRSAPATSRCATRHGLYRIVGRPRAHVEDRRPPASATTRWRRRSPRPGIAAAVVGDDRSLLAVDTGDALPSERVRVRLAAAAGCRCSRCTRVAVPALPRLASGKPDYVALAAASRSNRPPERDRYRGGVPRGLPSRTRSRPATASRALGGDSLRHVELSLELERRLGRLPPGWEAMPIAALARLDARPGRPPADRHRPR